MQRWVLTVILVAFSGLTALALWHHGYWGLVAPLWRTFGGMQVLADLVLALGLATVWMWRNARATGRNPWPWIVLTLVAGSFGPLAYLLGQRPTPPGNAR